MWQRESKTSIYGNYLLVILPLFTVGGWIATIFLDLSMVFPLFLSSVQLAIVGFRYKEINDQHRQLDHFLRVFGQLHASIHCFFTPDWHSTRLRELHDDLFGKEHDALSASRVLYKIQQGFDQRGNVLVMLIMNALYMKDLHLLVRVNRWKLRYVSSLPSWLKAISEVDALVSLANYAFNHTDFVFPIPQSTCLLQGKSIGHPLIPRERLVTNDFQVSRVHEFYMITGANMAGKSTFLRSVGINLVLAHAGSVVSATEFYFQPMTLFSSMRTSDNLSKGASYFHAELLRLKRLIEIAQQEERTFVILDEILKGTNSVDKLNGSRDFLLRLLSLPISGLVATHDLELGKLASERPEHFMNNCFEITHTNDEIVYDYKLKPGISQNMNASILLRKMGLV